MTATENAPLPTLTCALCGRAYRRLDPHVLQIHGMPWRAYCLQFLPLGARAFAPDLLEHLRQLAIAQKAERNVTNPEVKVRSKLMARSPESRKKMSESRKGRKCLHVRGWTSVQRGTVIELICKKCGKTFSVYRAAASRRKYCSRACYLAEIVAPRGDLV